MLHCHLMASWEKKPENWSYNLKALIMVHSWMHIIKQNIFAGHLTDQLPQDEGKDALIHSRLMPRVKAWCHNLWLEITCLCNATLSKQEPGVCSEQQLGPSTWQFLYLNPIGSAQSIIQDWIQCTQSEPLCLLTLGTHYPGTCSGLRQTVTWAGSGAGLYGPAVEQRGTPHEKGWEASTLGSLCSAQCAQQAHWAQSRGQEHLKRGNGWSYSRKACNHLIDIFLAG